jgi:hypothetical protein
MYTVSQREEGLLESIWMGKHHGAVAIRNSAQRRSVSEEEIDSQAGRGVVL